MKKLIPTLLLLPTLSFAIDGGTKAKKGDYPALVRMTNTQNGYYETCSGSLIAPNIVVTAAHCVDEFNFEEQRISKANNRRGDLEGLFTRTFKVKKVYYHKDAKSTKSQVRMISNFVNSPSFYYRSDDQQMTARENLAELEKKEIDIDIAFIELTKNQDIKEDQLMRLSCQSLPEGSDVLLLGFGKNMKDHDSENENPEHILEIGKNFYFNSEYIFDVRMGSVPNHGDSGGPLLLKSSPREIFGIASYKTLDKNGDSLTGVYSSLSSIWAKELYRDILSDAKAPKNLKELVGKCLDE
jgi:hypothetical protein